jgi:hypothetical protein
MLIARRMIRLWNRWRKRIDPIEEERQSAFGVWRYGYEYIKASKTVDDHDSNPWVASSVTYQCACQGIELAFKAYLRAKGHDLHSLRKFGHSLVKCMKAATKYGLPARSIADATAIRMVDPYYKAQEFRYIKTGLKEYPNIGELMRAGAVLLDAVADDVAAAMGSPALANRMKLNTSAEFGFTQPPPMPVPRTPVSFPS